MQTIPLSTPTAKTVLATLALLLATGCTQKKVQECESLVQVINGGVQSVDKAGKPSTEDGGIQDLQSMADSMDRVAADASKLPLTVPELKKFAGDYQTMAKGLASGARAIASVAQLKDAKKTAEAQTAMERSIKQEASLVDAINKFCQQP